MTNEPKRPEGRIYDVIEESKALVRQSKELLARTAPLVAREEAAAGRADQTTE